MARQYAKFDFPVDQARRYLEPGPVVLLTSAHAGRTNVMTLGWQTVMEFTPSLVGCVIASSNRTFEMVRRSKQCVINVPTVDLASAVVRVGNCSADEVGGDKFAAFGLTPTAGVDVAAPLIAECPISFECRLADGAMVRKYNFFVWEVVRAHVARSPKYHRTMHYHGKGVFTIAGRRVNLNRQFTKWKDV